MEINPQGSPTPITETPVEPVDVQPTPVIPQTAATEEDIKGLTKEEYNDPNKIEVTISDPQSPIVVLFGPPASGKTMTLIRLTRYLKTKNYRVIPIRTFRPSADQHYKKMCDEFDYMVDNNSAAESTNNISFMLVQVLDSSGRTICQILEAPGELYYYPSEPSRPFPYYVNMITQCANRKIWCFIMESSLVDPNHRYSDSSVRGGYVNKIHSLKPEMNVHDKAVFVYNKIDQTPFVKGIGVVNEKEARKNLEYLYPSLFVPFQSVGIFGKSDDFKLVPFQTGKYTETFGGSKTYAPSPDVYPKKLWETIYKIVRG